MTVARRRRAPALLAALFAAALLASPAARAKKPSPAKGVAQIVGDVVRGNYSALHACFEPILAIDRSRGGTVFVQVTLGRGDRVQSAKVARDELNNKIVAECVRRLTTRWILRGVGRAGALPGNNIIIPLTFRAAPHQIVVRPAALGWYKLAAKRGVRARDLLTHNNSGARKAQMRVLRVARTLRLTAKPLDRAIVVLAGGGRARYRASGRRGARGRLPVGAALWLPPNRGVSISGRALRLLVVTVPRVSGSKTPRPSALRVSLRRPRKRVLAKGKLVIEPLLDSKRMGHRRFYLGVLRARAGLRVPEHSHLSEAEVLYLQRGGGPMKHEGRTFPVAGPAGIYIPSGDVHSLAVKRDIVSIQIYAPAGPEQRFFKAAAKKKP